MGIEHRKMGKLGCKDRAGSGVCNGITTNRQKMREITENTLFLQNRVGILKVKVTVTSFPVEAAPTAAGSARARFARCGKNVVQAVRAPQMMAQTDAGGAAEIMVVGKGEMTGQARVPTTPPENKKTRPMEKKRENED